MSNRLKKIEKALGYNVKPVILLVATDTGYAEMEPWGSDNVVKEYTPQEVDQLQETHRVIVYGWGL